MFQLLEELKQGKDRLMSIILSSKGICDNFGNNEVSGVMAMEVKESEIVVNMTKESKNLRETEI